MYLLLSIQLHTHMTLAQHLRASDDEGWIFIVPALILTHVVCISSKKKPRMEIMQLSLLDIYVLYFVVWAFLLWFLFSCYSLFSKKIIKNATSLIVIYKFIRNLNFYMVLFSFRMLYMSLRLNLEYYSYIFRAKELLTCMKIRNLFVFM